MYKIEKGIDIPSNGGVGTQLYPFDDMETGDSFSAPISKKSNVQQAVMRHNKTNPETRFITRTVKGRGRSGTKIRVWRVK